MKIIGDRVLIRPLELEDVFFMRNWGHHENPLMDDYNFPVLTDNQIKKWYRYKMNSLFSSYYGVENENQRLIGYMGIKRIRYILRKSTLGIVFDPSFVSKGYGTDALRAFLNHYFNEMKMKKMYLEVADYNYRAKKLYEKMGFTDAGYYLDEFHNQELDLSNKYYLKSKSSFVIDNKKIYNYIYWMELTKENFMEIWR